MSAKMKWFRSNYWRCSLRKGILRNFAKIHRKTAVSKSFFNKVAGLSPEETLAQVFSCEFCDISKNTFFTEHLWVIASDG